MFGMQEHAQQFVLMSISIYLPKYDFGCHLLQITACLGFIFFTLHFICVSLFLVEMKYRNCCRNTLPRNDIFCYLFTHSISIELTETLCCLRPSTYSELLNHFLYGITKTIPIATSLSSQFPKRTASVKLFVLKLYLTHLVCCGVCP